MAIPRATAVSAHSAPSDAIAPGTDHTVTRCGKTSAETAPPIGRAVCRMPIASPRSPGDHTIAELAELCSVSRATIYREIARARRDPT